MVSLPRKKCLDTTASMGGQDDQVAALAFRRADDRLVRRVVFHVKRRGIDTDVTRNLGGFRPGASGGRSWVKVFGGGTLLGSGALRD